VSSILVILELFIVFPGNALTFKHNERRPVEFESKKTNTPRHVTARVGTP
jgi:hypothetical protein